MIVLQASCQTVTTDRLAHDTFSSQIVDSTAYTGSGAQLSHTLVPEDVRAAFPSGHNVRTTVNIEIRNADLEPNTCLTPMNLIF